MIRAFRRNADGFLAKLLLGFLVLTFALWGIGDIFQGAPENVIALVNDTPITLAELEGSIRREQDRTPELTAEVAQSLPVRLQMLNRIINTRLLEAEAKAIGLDFSEEALSKHIAEDPMFQNEQGRFSRDIFLSILRQNNISQGIFMHQIESDLRINLINGVIANSIKATPEMAELYYHISNEEREASLILLKESDVAKPSAPTDEEQVAFYEANKEQFRRPEYRTYRYVYFNAASLAKAQGITISAEDLRAYYDKQYEASEQKPDFDSVKDELRSLLTEDRMNALLTELSGKLDDGIAAGLRLEEAMTQAGLSQVKIETLGPISSMNRLKNGEAYGMKPIEQEILSAAFDQNAGDISPISVSADGHYYLVETLEVMPSSIPEMSEVAALIEREMMAQRYIEALKASATKLAAELREAENPKALAQEQGYSLHATGRIKRMHDTVANNSQLKNKILPSELIRSLFALKEGEVSEAFALPSGEIALGILNVIHPSKNPDTAAIEATKQELTTQLRLQALNAYLSALRDRYKVELFIDKIVPNAAVAAPE